jgi:hypothetical protein
MRYFLSAALIIMPVCVFSQDRIKKVNGDIIQAKVLEVSADEVRYKRYSNPDGPCMYLERMK